MKVSARLCSLPEAPGKSLFLALSGFQLLALLGLWPHHSNLCFRLHLASSLCVCVLSSSVSSKASHHRMEGHS